MPDSCNNGVEKSDANIIENMQQSMNTGAENDEKHLQTSVQAPRVLRPVGGYL